MAILPGAWWYRVTLGLVGPVSEYGEMASLICNLYLRVAERTTVWRDPSLRYTSMLLGYWAINKQHPSGKHSTNNDSPGLLLGTSLNIPDEIKTTKIKKQRSYKLNLLIVSCKLKGMATFAKHPNKIFIVAINALGFYQTSLSHVLLLLFDTCYLVVWDGTALHCTAQHWIISYCIALYRVVSCRVYCIVLYYVALRCDAVWGAALCHVALIVLLCIVPYRTVLYCTGPE